MDFRCIWPMDGDPEGLLNDTALIDAGMAWSDPASHPKRVIQPVGGYIVPVCKLDLLVPLTGFVLGLLAAMAITISLFRLRKH